LKGKPRQPTGGKAGGASGRTDSDAYINEAIAKKMIDFAKAGEQNPDLLCERVLNIIRMHCRAWRQLLRISKSEPDVFGLQSTHSRIV
jgi:hypothetical protein